MKLNEASKVQKRRDTYNEKVFRRKGSLMPRYVVTATKDVGYQTIIEAPDQETAWMIADNPTEEQREKFNWVQTDDGHDWTLENVWEFEDDDLQEIPPHEKFEVSQAANNDVSTEIDGLTKEEVEAIDEKISDYEADGLIISETEKRFLRIHEAHHLKFEKLLRKIQNNQA